MKHRLKNEFDLERKVAGTKQQLDIIELVHQFELARSNFLAAIIRREYNSFNQSLTLMHTTGLLAKPEEQDDGRAIFHFNHIYEDAPRGLELLEERRLPYKFVKTYRPRGSGQRIEWEHSLGIADTMLSLLAGSLDTPCRLVPQEEIEVRHFNKRLSYPLFLTAVIKGTYKGKDTVRKVKAVPDATFGITYPNDKTSFYALEYQNTGATKKNDLAQSSLYKKVLAYDDILTNQTYKAEWGIPNLRAVLFVFHNEAAMREALNCIAKYSKKPEKYFCYFYPRFTLSEKGYKCAPKPDLGMFTNPWLRAGLEPAYLYQEKDPT